MRGISRMSKAHVTAMGITLIYIYIYRGLEARAPVWAGLQMKLTYLPNEVNLLGQ